MQAPRYCPRCGQAITGEACKFCTPPSLIYWQDVTFVLNWRQDDGRPFPSIRAVIRGERRMQQHGKV